MTKEQTMQKKWNAYQSTSKEFREAVDFSSFVIGTYDFSNIKGGKK